MTAKHPHRSRDANQLAKAIINEATGEAEPASKEDLSESEKNPAAVALGRLGGAKGGKARAEKLSPEKRRDIARKAAKARWAQPDEGS